MQFNVASLLKGPVGVTQHHRLDEQSVAEDDTQAERVWGQVTLVHLNDGIWVRGDLQAKVRCTCSRCLQAYSTTLRFHIEETYYPTLDISTGVEVSLPEDAETDATIDDHHILDISEVVRQDIILATPMKPLCKTDCAGICPQCGADLNESSCACPKEPVDRRWASLSDMLSHRKN